MAERETVHGRIERAKVDVTATEALMAVALAAAIGFTLLFLQDPLAHDAMHNFRHGAGITCH